MEMDHLYYFLALANKRSITEVANQFSTTEEYVEAELASLQDKFKVKLFNRAAEEIIISEAGQKFLYHAQNIVDTLEGIKREFIVEQPGY